MRGPRAGAPTARTAALRPRRRRRLGTAWRATTATSARLAVRRARRDLPLLLVLASLVGVSTLLAVAGPRLVARTVDGGAQDAVRTAGTAQTRLTFTAPVGHVGGNARPIASVPRFDQLAAGIGDRLPPGLRAVAAGSTASLLGPPLTLLERDGVPDAPDDVDGHVTVAVAEVPAGAGLRLLEGALPAERAAGDRPVEVVVAVPAAERAGLEVGTEIAISPSAALDAVTRERMLRLVVVGIVGPGDAAAPEWERLPELWEPATNPTTARDEFTRLTVLADSSGVEVLADAVVEPFTGVVTVDVDPAAFSADRARDVLDELGALDANTVPLTDRGGYPLVLGTELDRVLGAYPAQARAALAQMSMMIAGVVGVAAVVLVLLARLLVVRRTPALVLERARGSSVPAVLVRLGAEALVVTTVGVAVGLGAAALLGLARVGDPVPLALVAAVGVLAGPLQAAWATRRAWTGRREPANRQDRAQLARRRRVRRLVVEASVVVLAAAAAVSVRSRGLLQDTTEGVDPLLAAAPLLLALAVTLVLLRVHPWPVRAAGAVGRRTPGVLGLLGAVRAQRAVAPLPLLALTLGVALAVAGGLLVGTVRAGQVDASWERVGADVRVDADVDPARVDELRGLPDVRVASGKVAREVTFSLGTTQEKITVVAVDEGFADVVAGVPGEDEGIEALGVLRGPGATDRLPVVLDADLADRVVASELGMYLGPSFVPLEVVGTTSFAPDGYLTGPFLFADLDRLREISGDPVVPDTVWLLGPGADAAAERLEVPAQDVLSRAAWLDARRSLALLAGVETMMRLAVAAVCVLGAVALVATVLAGARERGRALAMLRTLGMSPRLGWWLALAELGPVVVAALVGGSAAGVAVVLLLSSALGLDVLAGGSAVPAPATSPDMVVGLAVGTAVLLGVAVVAEVLAHRRDRLSEVLRVGDAA